MLRYRLFNKSVLTISDT